MQKRKRFNNIKNAAQLRPIAEDFKFKKGIVSAIVPIRKENGKPKYRVKISINNSGDYRVYIIEPKLKKTDGNNPPHIYPDKSRWNKERQEFDACCLCLHLPGSDEYDKSELLIKTIIAWVIKWTEFYEIWLMTGVWFAKEEHPSSEKDKEEIDKANGRRHKKYEKSDKKANFGSI